VHLVVLCQDIGEVGVVEVGVGTVKVIVHFNTDTQSSGPSL